MSQLKMISVTADMGADWVVSANIRDHKVLIDQPKNAGGTDTGPSPLEMFLFSLGGCVASIARIAAKQQKIDLRGIQVTVAGGLNPDGLMGRDTEDRAGFQQIKVSAVIDADLTDEEKQVFLDRVCERCPVHDNIKLSTAVLHQLDVVA